MSRQQVSIAKPPPSSPEADIVRQPEKQSGRSGEQMTFVGRGSLVGQPVQRRVKRVERVKAGGVDIFVELADSTEGLTDSYGPQPAGIREVLSFDGVRETVEAVAREVVQVWDHVKPTEASVEFGVSLTARSGKLTGLLVDGEGAGSLKVTLTWRAAAGD